MIYNVLMGTSKFKLSLTHSQFYVTVAVILHSYVQLHFCNSFVATSKYYNVVGLSPCPPGSIIRSKLLLAGHSTLFFLVVL